MRATERVEIVTPRAVYAATFSPDGRWLMYGGGFYSGQGFLCQIDHEAGLPAGEEPEDLLEPIREEIVGAVLRSRFIRPGNRTQDVAHHLELEHFTISGLCFDQSGSYLGVSVWKACHNYFPTLLLCVGEDSVAVGSVFIEDQEWFSRAAEGDRDTATGVLIVDDRLVVRRTTTAAERAFYAFDLPPGVEGGAEPGRLASSRLAVVRGGLATGAPGRLDESGALRVSAEIRSGALDARDLPCPSRVAVGAVVADAIGSTLLAGGDDGNITAWEFPTRSPAYRSAGSAAGEEKESAITAACSLCEEGLIATADRGGRVAIWRGREKALEWRIPGLSIRTLAAHPTEPRLAVGAKATEGGPNPGRLLVFDLDLG